MLSNDVPAVMEIERRSYPFPWSEGIMRDCIDTGYACTLLMQGEHMVGYGVFAMAVDECHVLNLCIDPANRRRGLGRHLMQLLLKQAKKQGVKTAFLEVRCSNHSALDLYQKLGFSEVGYRKAYYPNHTGREDAIVMAMDLVENSHPDSPVFFR